MLATLALAGLIAGGVAAVAGFGIGSLLTPAFAAFVPARLAVAAVSIPHFVATAYRLWLIREHIDYRVLRSFGVMSAAGGLAGAIVHQIVASRALELVLVLLLLFVGVSSLFGINQRIRFDGVWAWLAGGASGFLGGLVGNQGGIRAGAMMGLGVARDAFVATSTAIGLIVDLARMPVYVAGLHGELLQQWQGIAVMTGSVVAGTYLGIKLLRKIPPDAFFRVVSVLLIALAIWLFMK